GARQRPGFVRRGAGARLGRSDREAGGLALQVGQADARLAQGEARARAGVRGRRLDRAAQRALVLRRAAARRLRGRRSGLRRPYRHRVQRERAGARDGAAEAARDPRVALQEPAEDQRAAALGASRAGRAEQVHRVDRRQQAAASGVPRSARGQGAEGGEEGGGGRERTGSAFGVRRSGFSFRWFWFGRFSFWGFRFWWFWWFWFYWFWFYWFWF